MLLLIVHLKNKNRALGLHFALAFCKTCVSTLLGFLAFSSVGAPTVTGAEEIVSHE